jgi:hypothetical protein
MACPVCAMGNELEFPTEAILHPSGFNNVGNPGVLVFPKLLVCLNCGFSLFFIPNAELAILAAIPPSEKLTTAAAG